MNYRVVLTILFLIALGELGWLGWRMYSLKVARVAKVETRLEATDKVGENGEEVMEKGQGKGSAKLWLEPVEGEFSGQFSVDVFLQTDVAIDGVDVHLFYPTDKLSVDEVQTGTFEDYPVNKVENGLVSLSGVVLGNESKMTLNEPVLVGKVVFTTVAAGEAELSFEFEPGSDKDSNVAQSGTAVDILREASGANFVLK